MRLTEAGVKLLFTPSCVASEWMMSLLDGCLALKARSSSISKRLRWKALPINAHIQLSCAATNLRSHLPLPGRRLPAWKPPEAQPLSPRRLVTNDRFSTRGARVTNYHVLIDHENENCMVASPWCLMILELDTWRRSRCRTQKVTAIKSNKNQDKCLLIGHYSLLFLLFLFSLFVYFY